MCARAKKEKERERGAFFGAFFCVVPFFGQRGTEKKSACRMRNYIISFSRAKPFDDDDDGDR